MLIVRVPPWAAASKKFKIPANVEQNMPKAATTHPVDLYVTGIELAWAAAMSGRPELFLKNPSSASNAEFAQWRVTSCLRLLEPARQYLRRPAIFHSEVDPTEKGYLNFMLGGTLTMAYLTKKLGIHWLAHYSLVKKCPNFLITRNTSGRIEPDYIGLDNNQRFFVAEAKGRMELDPETKSKLNAKTQTKVVHSVNGQASLPGFGIAAIAGGPEIELYATDPEVEMPLLDPQEWVRAYYDYARAVCGPEGQVIDASQGPKYWVPISLELPEFVSQWSATETRRPEWGRPQRYDSEWNRIVERAQEQSVTSGQELLPDLTMAAPRRPHTERN